MSSSPVLLVMAAGMGSRYGGLKQAEGIGPQGETLLDYSLYDARRAGFEDVVFIIRRDMERIFRERIVVRFEHKINCSFVFQELDDLPSGFVAPASREKPWGTGHAVRSARNVVDTNFAVINADDYYGADAYNILAEMLRASPRKDLFALVGYRLQNTLSEHGSVSRGVCRVSNGDFIGVSEVHGIQRNDEGIMATDPVANYTGEEVVSMNMWGFTPYAFDLLEEGFSEFLTANMDKPDSEFYLPVCINDAVASGKASISLLNTDERWFGLTYQEDKARVQQEIRSKIENWVYPRELWV